MSAFGTQINVVLARGNKPKDAVISTGALTLAADNVAISYNIGSSTGLTRGEVDLMLEYIEQHLLQRSFPAA